MILIALRISTVKECDMIYMLEEGKIVDQGTYEELLADEEGHIDFLETEIGLLDQIGVEKYGLLNAKPADDAE